MRAKFLLDEALASRLFVSLSIMGMRSASILAKFALTLFLARFLDLSALGIYGLITGATVVFPVVAGLGLIKIVSRNAVSQDLTELTPMLRRYAWILAVIYGVVTGIALIAGIELAKPALAMLVVAIVFLEHVNGDLLVVLNHLLQPRLANALLFVRTAGWIVVYIVFAFAAPELRSLDALLAFWIAGGLTSLAGFCVAARHWPWQQSQLAPARRDWFARHFRDSRVIYLNDVANSAAQYSDRYIVGFFLGLELTGVYVLFWSIGNALSNLVSSSIIQLSEPKLIAAHRRQDGTYWAVFRRLLIETASSSIALACAAAVFMHVAIPYLQRPLLTDWLPVLTLILVGFAARMIYEAQGSVFYSRYSDRLTLFSGIFVIALSTVANLVLVPPYTLYGAANSIIASYILGALVRQIMITRYCK